MTKTEVTDVHIKACRKANLKAGADLSKKVNRIVVDIEQSFNEELNKECLNLDMKWLGESEDAKCEEI